MIKATWVLACVAAMAVGIGVTYSAAPNRQASASTAPTTQVESPKEVILAFFDGLEKGDEKAALGSLWFASEDVKTEAQTVLGVEFARQQFDKAMQEAFHEKPAQRETAGIGTMMHKQMDSAAVSMSGETADVKVGPEVFHLVKKQGQWKIDFDQMQKADKSPRMGKVDLEIVQAGMKVYREMAADVKTGKFKTAEDARAELNKRMDAAPMSDEARRTATQRGLAAIMSALETFDVENGRLPTIEEGLAALVKEPAGLRGKNWQPLLGRVPVDGWGRTFIYRTPGKEGKRYDLFSPGPDGKADTADDVR